MKINKKEMIATITKLKPGISTKGIIEQAGHVIFSRDEAATYNDQVCIIHPFPLDFSFSVDCDEFLKILNGMSENEFDLTLKDNTVKYSCKGTKGSLSTIVNEEAKVEHLIANIKRSIDSADFFKPLPKEFIDGLYLCAFSANKDIATGVRACVAVKADTIYSTDGIRASTYIMDSSMDEILIPAKSAIDLCKFNPTSYGVSDNWIHFKTEEGVVFNCKTMKGDYPYKSVAKIFEDVEPDIEFPSVLKDTVSSVIGLAEGDMDVNKMVRINVTGKAIVVRAEKERGWIEKSIDFVYDGEPFDFIINPIFFNQILQHATGFTLIENKAQFASDNFYHVLALPTEQVIMLDNTARHKMMVDKLKREVDAGRIDNEWVEGFILSTHSQLKTKRPLSTNQILKLEELFDKY